MWRPVIKILVGTTTWWALGLVGGAYIGQKIGYSRGVHDIASLIIIMREVDQPPAPFTEGGI